MMTHNPTKLCPLIMLGLLLLPASANAMDKCGAVCDETWTLAGSPYVVTCDVTLAAGCTLMIDSGVEVRFQAGTGLEVSGTLDVNGVSGSEVSFVSDADTPAAGDWAGLVLQSGSSGTLDHAEVRHATDGVYSAGTVSLSDVALIEGQTGVQIAGGSATLSQVTTSDNTNYGVYVNGGTSVTLSGLTSQRNGAGLYVYANSTVDVSGSTLTDNTTYGVFVDGGINYAPALTIGGSSIHSNLGSYDLWAQRYLNAGEQVLQATGNWWGSTEEATIAGRIYDHTHDSGSPMVDWCGHLASAGGPAVRDVYCPDLAVCNETAVWNLTDKPYLLHSDVVVCPTGTLQVEAGVTARVVEGNAIGVQVSGTLDVNGVSGSEVSFVSDADTPAAGDWAGLVLQSGSSGTLDHAEVRHATDGVYSAGTVSLSDVALIEGQTGVQIAGGSATLSQVTTSDNTNYGVYVNGGTSVTLSGLTSQRNNLGLYVVQTNTLVDVSGSTLTDNVTYGVMTDGGYYQSHAPALTIGGSSIHSNLGSHDLYAMRYQNAPSTIIWAPDNWWGSTRHQDIRERIFDNEDNSSSPLVYFKPFGDSCEIALCDDHDRDGLGDFADNCPMDHNTAQTDTDGDGMGDPCDPDPGVPPAGLCDGINDTFDGYVDTDADGWGDPCDFQPTREDCYPGAPELCDGRDNDGDGVLLFGELVDSDFDEAIECGDCDDAEPEVYPCACESCINLREDDCDGLMDGADPECFENPYCVVVTASTPEPDVNVEKGTCGGADLSGPFDVVRGQVSQLQFSGGSVDLGNVHCVEGGLDWDRVTDVSADPNPECNDTTLYFLARDSGAGDFGSAHPGSEPRDVMNPDPVCP